MSILIKGMDKPKSCTLCELMKNGGNSFYCPLQSKEANLKASLLIELYVNCPLISIPPHGRLIDADELFKEMERKGWFDNADRDKAEDLVLDAPTVIPAEPCKEKGE